jgi:prevent-host-death family protein
MLTVSARQIQRGYRKVLDDANKSEAPIIVMSNNKPIGAVIGLELLEKLQLDLVLKQALKESALGKTVIIDTPKKLQASFEDMRNEAKVKQ